MHPLLRYNYFYYEGISKKHNLPLMMPELVHETAVVAILILKAAYSLFYFFILHPYQQSGPALGRGQWDNRPGPHASTTK